MPKHHLTTGNVLRRQIGGSGFGWLGYGSNNPFPRLPHPYFTSPGICCAKPGFGLVKHRLSETLGDIISMIILVYSVLTIE